MNNLIVKSLYSLKKINIPNPELDIRILLKHASSTKKDIILSNVDFNKVNIEYFKILIKKRLDNQPISKIINKKYFWKDDFFVNNDVLDPRPATETIVEEVINKINNKDKFLKILDIGTGSGCLAISLAREFKNSKILAIDICKKAIDVAKQNVLSKNLDSQIEIKLLDLRKINEKFDIIVSNPPYLKNNEYDELQIEIKKFEPKLALLGGRDGLNFYRLFANQIENLMNKKAIFVCEIGHNQLKSCRSIFSNTKLKLNKVTKDIQNIDRTLTFFKE